MAERTTHVLVATPLGAGGRGGIDRLTDAIMRELTEHPRAGVEVACGASRGRGSILLSPVFLGRFCAGMVLRKLRGRVDVVHINLASAGSTYRKLVISRLAGMLGIPVVIHLHGGGMREFWDGAPEWMQRRIKAMFADAERIVVLGRVWAEFLRRRVPETAERICVLPNATPVPAPFPGRGDDDRPHIVFLGRLGPSKGIPELIDALAALPADLPWRATLAGDGGIEDARAHLRRAGLQDRVALLGWVGPQAVAGILGSADIVALPSHVENLPMTVIEAMAAGVAVIATPAGSTGDIVKDGKTGLLVPAGDRAALKDAIERLLRDEGLRRRLAEAGRALHRERLDMGPYTDRLVAIWKEAATLAPARRHLAAVRS